jgi:catechol 2,3-dioxygenase-like lactoylglutathione lyase family enzyme
MIGLSFEGETVIATTTATQVQRIALIGFTVSDLDRTVAFFEHVLGFRQIAEIEIAGAAYDTLNGLSGCKMRIARLELGAQTVEFTEHLSRRGRTIPLQWRANDHWFQHIAIVVSDMAKAYDRVRRHGVRQISVEPQTIPEWNVGAAGVQAVKLLDPDNHPLELLGFPPDKGHPCWHEATDRLFRGIDHTAITVSDTERSLKFYRDLLGLEVAFQGINSGITQELLDGVPEPQVRISTLVPKTSPPAIEFLHYQNPGGGSPVPADSSPADLWHWEITVVVENVAAAAEQLRAAGVRFMSSAVAAIPDPELGFSQAVMVLDPDHHAVRLVQK